MFQVFKLNFDGASKGNCGLTGYTGFCRDSIGRIMNIYYGAIGNDTNNSAELEGLIRGFECIIREGWLPTVIEGDSNILI